MVTDVPRYMHAQKGSNTHKCVVEYRNHPEPWIVMVRYQRKILHVYFEHEGEWQFCLAVELTFPNMTGNAHFAFTAHTGQVADAHDIFDIKGRYLDDDDQEIDDETLNRVDDSHWFSLHKVFWTLCIGASLFSLVVAIYHAWVYFQLSSHKINHIIACENINGTVALFHLSQVFITLIMLFTGHWIYFLINLPLFGFFVYQIVTNNHKVDGNILNTDDSKVHGGVKYIYRVIFFIVFYAVMASYYFANM